MDHRGLLVIKEKLEIQEIKVQQVKMENLVYLENQEDLVIEEKQETNTTIGAQEMVQGVIGVIKEIRVNQGDQADLDYLDLKEGLVEILKEDLVHQDNLAFQAEMEKMVLLVDQDTLDKREREEKEISQKKILEDTKKSCL